MKNNIVLLWIWFNSEKPKLKINIVLNCLNPFKENLV